MITGKPWRAMIPALMLMVASCGHHEKRETKYPEGKPKEAFEVLETNDGNFIKDGEYSTWYPNGQQESSGVYLKGKKVGDWKHWYSNGQMKSDVAYELDTLNGHYLTWYENGQKKIEAETSFEKYIGHYVSWFANGQMEMDIKRNKAGVLTGQYTEWHENGQVKRRGNSDDQGKKTGPLTLWNNDGQKIAEWNYRDDILNGSVKYWDSKGNLYLYREFKDSIDINLPAVYNRIGTDDKLEMNRDGTYKMNYLDRSFFGQGRKIAHGRFEITPPDAGPYLKFENLAQGILVKFKPDTIIYKNFHRTEIVFVKIHVSK